jgi:predicted dienelactone hydrolase
MTTNFNLLIAMLLSFHAFIYAFAAVKSEDISLRDEKRRKDLECRVYYPETGDKLPLIVFSHGFGADKTAFAAISQHIAKHGYVIVHPSHSDGFGRSNTSPQAGTIRDRIRNRNSGGSTPDTTRESDRRDTGRLADRLDDPVKIEGRVADVTCIIDSIEQLYNRVPALRGRIDTTRIGVGGHSYGAYTSMLIGGVTVDLDGKKARNFADPRVRCIMPISGQGTGQQGLSKSSWDNLKLPMLTMTGSRDQGASGQGPDWKKEPFQFSPPGDKYLVFIDGANHFSFGGYGGRETDTTRAVKETSLAFWNAYLKDDEKAKALLKSTEITQGLDGTTISAK